MSSFVKCNRGWFAAFLCLAHVALARAETFRVATFNIENYLDVQSGTRPPKSPEAQARVRECILAIKPDVIALEEVGSTNVLLNIQAGLKSNGLDLPNWEWVPGYDTNIHVCVLSRFPIVARRSHTNESFLLDGRRMRVSRGFAELDIQPNDKYKFTLIAAHLKSRRPSPLADEEEWRYEEAVCLRRVIDAHLTNNPGERLIVLGDFNDTKDSKPLHAIMGRGRLRLFDTRPAERNGDEPSKNGRGHESRNIAWTHFYAKDDVYSRIDYILISHGMETAWREEDTFVLSAPNWGQASDHRPLVAGFSIPEK